MRQATAPEQWKVIPIASGSLDVFASPDPESVHLSDPSVVALPGGRIVVSVDLSGPGLKKLPGLKGKLETSGHWVQTKILVSADRGQTWRVAQDVPFRNGRLFWDGHGLYLLGNRGAVQIVKSADGGDTWSRPEDLTTAKDVVGECVYAPGHILSDEGRVYAAVMTRADPNYRGDPDSVLAPVVLRAQEGGNLASRKSWTVSQPCGPFRDLIRTEGMDFFGVPFFDVPHADRGRDLGQGRWAHRIGWGAAHVLRVKDARHYWHARHGRRLHLVATSNAHRGNLAVLATVAEDESGAMTIGLQNTPADRREAFISLPGGNTRFDLFHDEATRLFWLVSNQIRDSLCRVERLPQGRPGLPCDDLQRLQIHFSRNLVDWCFAGFLDGVTETGEGRHSPSVTARGNDLYVVCCAGRVQHRPPFATPRVTLCTVPEFRELAY